MTALKMQITGVTRVVRALKKAGRQHQSAVVAALMQEANEVMRDSNANAPEVSGRLKRGAFVISPKTKDVNVDLGYAAPYATKVHEKNVTGQNRFLRRALDKRSKGMRSRLVKRTRANLRAGIGIRKVKRVFNTRPIDRKGKGGKK